MDKNGKETAVIGYNDRQRWRTRPSSFLPHFEKKKKENIAAYINFVL